MKMFLAPSIVQTDNGQEFVNDLLNELATYFPEMQFIRGRPRHSQSQGSVEALDKTVEHKLHAMLRDTGRKDWYNLDAVQHAINTQVHGATKKSPYDLVFACKPRPALFPGLPNLLVLDEEDIQQYIDYGTTPAGECCHWLVCY